ncbi:unnamed protein product, partial [Discosporangium mesarthrocarpum]
MWYYPSSAVIKVIRGGLSLPAVVILWTGLWVFLDLHVTGGTGVCKELILSLIGAVMMVQTRTYFSNAGMDTVDREGSLLEMGRLLRQGRLSWRDKATFYARCIVAMVGAILFWDGIFTLLEVHTWPSTLPYNAALALGGGAVTVWVNITEENDMKGASRGHGVEESPAEAWAKLNGQVHVVGFKSLTSMT